MKNTPPIHCRTCGWNHTLPCGREDCPLQVVDTSSLPVAEGPIHVSLARYGGDEEGNGDDSTDWWVPERDLLVNVPDDKSAPVTYSLGSGGPAGTIATLDDLRDVLRQATQVTSFAPPVPVAPTEVLSFAVFSAVNRERCESPQGFNHPLHSWSTSDWFTAILGELGEAANVAKKLNRVRDGIRGNKEAEDALRAKLRCELGDTFVYIDLLCQSLGFNVADAAVDVFNAKSDQIGCPIRIASLSRPVEDDPRIAELRAKNDELMRQCKELVRLVGERTDEAKRGWRCFHCGFMFVDPVEARAHFGEHSQTIPACVGKDDPRIAELVQKWRERAERADAVAADLLDTEGRIRKRTQAYYLNACADELKAALDAARRTTHE